MIEGFVASQDKGKTISMVLRAIELWDTGEFDEIVSMVSIPTIDKCQVLNVQGMRKYVKQMVTECKTKCLILIDEVDRIFPARFFKDKEQTEMLIGLWQDYKLLNHILYTSHGATTIDKILRDSNLGGVLHLPEYVKEIDTLYLFSIDFAHTNPFNPRVQMHEVLNLSNYFKLYNRWEIIR